MRMGRVGFWSGLALVFIAAAGCSPGKLSTESDGDAVRRRCGNGRCDGTETCSSCPTDCGMCDGSTSFDASMNPDSGSSDAGTSDAGVHPCPTTEPVSA